MASFEALPMEIENSRLWLVGFLVLVVLSGAIGIVFADLSTATAEFRVSATEADESVHVTVEQLHEGRFEVLRQTTVTNSQTVWTTTDPGWYRVTIANETNSCEYHVAIHRTDSGLIARSPGTPSQGCPARFSATVEQKFRLINNIDIVV
jgi:hypothetical protein